MLHRLATVLGAVGFLILDRLVAFRLKSWFGKSLGALWLSPGTPTCSLLWIASRCFPILSQCSALQHKATRMLGHSKMRPSRVQAFPCGWALA